MSGPRGTISRLQLGLFITIFGVTSFVGLFVRSQSKRLFVPKVEIRADFHTTSGLRKGSIVQLAGVEIGSVSRIDFVRKRYQCDPLSEDVGRFGQGRSDDCDDSLFCAPIGLCADLEPWVGRGEHAQCRNNDDCHEDEICVTTEFRRREPRVVWWGIHGVCARYNTEHIRVQAKMKIEADKMAIIRTDSRASVASNSVLGDQLVDITTGTGELLAGDMRVQTSPSLTEDIERFRARIVNFLDTAEVSLDAMNSVIAELKDERTIGDIKGTVQHLEIVTAHVAEQRGLVGALIGSPQYRNDFGQALRAIRKTTEGLDETVRVANRILATLDRNFEPLVEDARMAMLAFGQALEDLRDPGNHSLAATLVYDKDGRFADHTVALMHNIAALTESASSIVHAVDDRQGTLGLLLDDDRIGQDVSTLLHNLANNKRMRALVLWYLQRKGTIDLKGARDHAGPPRK